MNIYNGQNPFISSSNTRQGLLSNQTGISNQSSQKKSGNEIIKTHEEKKGELDKEFENLFNRYLTIVRFLERSSSKQAYTFLNQAWECLCTFASKHPEFKNRLPESKYQAYDPEKNKTNIHALGEVHQARNKSRALIMSKAKL